MYLHASGLTGVSPKTSACFASTFGVVTYFIHLYAQFGCGALLASIHVSAQPVVGTGTISFTGNLFACIASVWYGQPAPSQTSPPLNDEISSEAKLQNRLSRGFCRLSSFTVAESCAWVSSYGSLIPRLGCVFSRYKAASAIWIGLSGIVTWPAYFLL